MTDNNDNPILGYDDIYPTQVIGRWKVQSRTLKTVKVYLNSDKDLGYKTGGLFTFRWDGTGYKRQGQYIRKNDIG